MKARLLIIIGIITILSVGSFLILLQTPFADVAPCFNKEKNRHAPCLPETSIQFYEYKGGEWMETKKQEMIEAMLNDTFHAWIDQTKDDHSHWNVYQYYSYTEDLSKQILDLKGIDADLGWIAEDDSILKTSANCMTLEQNKETAPFFKTPAYLPNGYSHVCSQSGTPSESYIVYHHKEILNWNIPELISDGAIFIYQIDERNILDAEKLETLGTAEQRIQEDYDSVIESNPSLQPQLIRVNEILANAVDSCPDCGMQTANFADGTFIQKSTSTETKIKFIDENGINYMLKTSLPLDELILVAESLQ
ncbi:MAG: hypothetical protein ACW9W4_10410 [Candidatus Nitrosopumilus sp. bin_7KS]